MFEKILKIKEARTAISELEASVQAKEEQLVQANSELEAAKDYTSLLQGECTEKDLQLSELEGQLQEINGKYEQLQNEQVNAAAAAADIVAEIGLEQPVEVENPESNSREAILAEFESLKDSKSKIEFYQKHREILLNR